MKDEKRGWWMTAMMDMPRAAMSDKDLRMCQTEKSQLQLEHTPLERQHDHTQAHALCI
jgi:hypothetical protein